MKCCKSALNIFFSGLNKKDFEVLFLKSIQKINVKHWDEKGKVQDSDSNYFFYDTSVDSPTSELINDSTLAEAAEVLKKGDNCILAINLPDLKFSKQYQLYVNIISRIDRQDIYSVSICCSDNKEGINFWIDSYLDEKLKYTDFSRTPLDQETCLINRQKFKKTGRQNSQGRHVYQDTLNRLWYVDNAHKGEGAHIEVFNKNSNHIGISDLKGNIDYSEKIPGRLLD